MSIKHSLTKCTKCAHESNDRCNTCECQQNLREINRSMDKLFEAFHETDKLFNANQGLTTQQVIDRDYYGEDSYSNGLPYNLPNGFSTGSFAAFGLVEAATLQATFESSIVDFYNPPNTIAPHKVFIRHLRPIPNAFIKAIQSPLNNDLVEVASHVDVYVDAIVPENKRGALRGIATYEIRKKGHLTPHIKVITFTAQLETIP